MIKFGKRSITSHEAKQFLWYFLGGTVYFWSGYLVFAACYGPLHMTWWLAKILGDVVGWSFNYVIQRYKAFNTVKVTHHSGTTLKKYLLLNAANLGIDYLIVGGLQGIGISPYIGLWISAGFFTVWNYFWYRFWVFMGDNKKEGNRHVRISTTN